MEVFEIIAEVLKYVVPGGLILLTIKYLNDSNIEKEKLAQNAMLRKEIIDKHLPLRISAYERVVLLLERISPQNLLFRVNGSGKSSAQFHQELVQEIRNEYEHNLAQQVYVSNHGWIALLQAKEEILSLINNAAREMPEDADGIMLSKVIIEKTASMKDLPSQKAIFVLKGDIYKLFQI